MSSKIEIVTKLTLDGNDVLYIPHKSIVSKHTMLYCFRLHDLGKPKLVANEHEKMLCNSPFTPALTKPEYNRSNKVRPKPCYIIIAPC